MVDQESRWSVSAAGKFGHLGELKLCLVPEYAWDTLEIQSHYFESDYVAAQYAWILYRPWKTTRGYSYSILKRTFECSEQLGPRGRPDCCRQARRRFEQ